jgi:hypothetical protein
MTSLEIFLIVFTAVLSIFNVMQFLKNSMLQDENYFHFEDNQRLMQENELLKHRFVSISTKAELFSDPDPLNEEDLIEFK